MDSAQKSLMDKDPERYLDECTKILPEAIDEEFVRTPADLAYWNAKYADALDRFLRAKAHADSEWARLWLLTREELLAKDGKATEKVIDAKTEGHPDWAKAQVALIDAEVEKTRLGGRCDAVRTKKDMLQSLGAKIRAEIETDPQVRASHAAARDAARGR